MTEHRQSFLCQERQIRELRKALNDRLMQLLPDKGSHDRVSAAMRAGTLSGGKRIRPMLLILVAQDLGCEKNHPALLDFACAVEMIHASSLILDDLPCMDNALTRRGLPTVHRQFGEHVSILAVVALLSSAFGAIASAEGLSATSRIQALAELTSAVGIQGLVEGQQRDLDLHHDMKNIEAVIKTNHLKTSRLFEAALHMAALVVGASPTVHLTLRRVAEELGQAFQLLDDLADNQAGTGKDRDQDMHKLTLVTLSGRKEVCQRLRDHVHRADVLLAEVCQGCETRNFIFSWFDQQLTSFCGLSL